MTGARTSLLAVSLAAIVAGAACASAPVQHPATPPADAPVKGMHYPTEAQLALGIYQPWSDADIDFMSGMIPHHAQAVIMAGWAASHGARKELVVLCERIVVGQRDEIALMQQWLRDRHLRVPDATSTRHKMKMMVEGEEMEHDMLMPGMLSDEEMTALDKARGTEWDRLFLLGMIKHHQGALDMVDKLFKSYGAAQSDDMYKFASDVHADQEIEIEVMKSMLAGIGGW